MMSLEQKVKQANKDFYDIVGPSYEDIDARRSGELVNYLTNELANISRSIEADSVLDLGCGGGFVSKAAAKHFKRRYALDISLKTVSSVNETGLYKITADSGLIPIGDAQLGCVVTFAVLHHLPSYKQMLPEVYRVLKQGGIYYSDHDMDSLFFNRFRPLVSIYRKAANKKGRYLTRFGELSEEMYDCAEFHRNGIPSESIESILNTAGFRSVKLEYHWFGLTRFTDKIFGKKSYKRGCAPLVKIIAVK